MFEIIKLIETKKQIPGVIIEGEPVIALKIHKKLINTIFTGDSFKPFLSADDIANIICDYVSKKFEPVVSYETVILDGEKTNLFEEEFIYRGKTGDISFHVKKQSKFLVVDSVACNISYKI